ncbi:hypothetical protein PTSG_12866 [Salpingoeca rosetta]|uniref:WSC domain-containing protein n=1 Tax=Salpingoeca rosetta (strain ATCC 50818 / BSB-021) TaxID=946362 RepID=F2UM85_SALR5|nr:uncharacterized protein PTSG_12866 [Salpingoeca rosetta]EGD78234.1 hypothetical protein PTSG_12866 [Salpingoeca rosetta]|eukprot:XP_004989557.1 hypothetical protein PTSG_12866 [Salpingoeca rosetta]
MRTSPAAVVVPLLAALAVLAACCGLTTCSAIASSDGPLWGPYQLPQYLTGLNTATVSASDDGDRILLAWMADDGVYAAVSNAESVKNGDLGTPSKVFNKTLAQSGSVTVDMNHAGYSGWILVSQATVVAGGARCTISAIRWEGTFELPTTIISLGVADKLACGLDSMTVTVADDGSAVNALFAYRPDAGSNDAKAINLAWDAANGWSPNYICCDPGLHTFASPATFDVGTDAIGNTAIASFVVANDDLTSYRLKTVAVTGATTLYTASLPLPGTAEVSVAAVDSGNTIITLVNNGSTIVAVRYDIDAQRQRELGLVYRAGAGEDIVNMQHAITNNRDVTIAFQQRNLNTDTSYVCQVTLDAVLCTSPLQLNTRTSDSPSDNLNIAGFSSVVAIAYTAGVGTVSPDSKQIVGGFFGFPSEAKASPPLTNVTIATELARDGFCNVLVDVQVMRANGSAVVLWTGLRCNDGCAVCTRPVYEAAYALWQDAFDGGSACAPQFVCVARDLGAFPTDSSCSIGCDEPIIANGYVCTDSGECKQQRTGAYPTMDTCTDVCVPLKNKHFKKPISGGGVFLLILVFGFIVPYFVGGVIYNKLVHNATGVELLPHAEFWTQTLPRAVGDGVRFVTCRRPHGSEGTYDSL